MPGAVDLVRFLREKYQVVFFTNNSTKTIDQVHDKLNKLKIECKLNEVYTSASDYISQLVENLENINPEIIIYICETYHHYNLIEGNNHLQDQFIRILSRQNVARELKKKILSVLTSKGLYNYLESQIIPELIEEGRYDEAIAECNKAIELDPNMAGAYVNRSFAYSKKGEFDKTIADCNKAIELDPNLADAYNNRGIAYYNKGDYDKAARDFKKAIMLNPENAKAYNNLRIIKKLQKETDKNNQ